MIPISGTIRNAVKLQLLDCKWQEKKQNGKIFEKETDPQIRQLHQFQEDLKKMHEGDIMSAIASKMKAGEDLTPEEVEYLQKNAPDMYREYLEIKGEKEAYKRQLKDCKTKEEVERLKVNKMNGILSQAKSVMNNPNIPKGAKVGIMEKLLMKAMGIEKVHQLFIKSGEYAKLPTDEEYAKEKGEANQEKNVPVEETPDTEDGKDKEDTEVSEEETAPEQAEVLPTENLTDREKLSEKESSSGEVELQENKMKKPTKTGSNAVNRATDNSFAEVKGVLTDFIRKNSTGGHSTVDVHC